MKIGFGYDVHKYVKDRNLILGGVKIENDLGLLGHSDADVLVHAIMDAILGALGRGDIGKLFPDTYSKFKDISSLELLKEVKKVMEDDGYSIGNIDSTIVCQKPKLRPYIDQMQDNIAMCLGVCSNKINVKATTEEGLGFTGSLEGISSNAVCLLENIR